MSKQVLRVGVGGPVGSVKPALLRSICTELRDQYNIAVNQTISLTGAVEIDGAINNNFPVQWEKVEGPGRVKIASPNNRTTNISFSEAGTYLIRFSAVDDNFPEEDAKWVTVIDFVKVVVE